MAGFKEYQMLFSLNANLGGGFSSTFSSGSSAIAQLQNKIEALNRTQGDISAYQKQQQAVEKSKSKLELYQTQLENLKKAQATSSVEEAKLANEIAAKEKQVTDATAALDKNEAKLSEMGQSLREAGVDTANLATETDRLKAEAAEAADAQMKEAQAAEDAGKRFSEAMQGAQAALEAAGLIAGLKKVADGLMDCSKAAAEFETNMAAVKRTVGGDDSFIKGLGESFKQMSTEMPITASELAQIATTAGQLGIAQDNVETFTTVMAKLATTTDLSADNAATMLAQFANITGVTDYERLGSAVAALGDSTATTASKVVDMSQGMAASASIAGMSSTDILAISAAVGSLGIEAAAGSTAMSQLITKLYKATETGDQLEQIAAVAGMTGEQFRTAWGQNAVGAMDSFIQGLNNVEQNGASAVVVLDQLGINNVRQTKAILGLASADGLLANTISVANNAWNQNTALTEKAGIMYNTTEAKMTMMQNAANNVQIAIGDALNPALSAAYDAATQLLQPIAQFLEENPAIVQGITAFIGVLGTLTAGIVAYTAITKLAAAASALFAGAIPGLGIILGVAAGIGTLVAAISALTGANEDATPSFEDLQASFNDFTSDIEKNKEIIKLADDYEDLNKQAGNLQSLMDKGFKTNITFSKSKGKLTPEDFVDGNKVMLEPGVAEKLAGTDFLTNSIIQLTPEQKDYLVANDFIDGQLTVQLTPEQKNLLLSDSFLKSTKVRLTPEQKKYLKSDDFIEGDNVIQLTPEQASKLAAAGFLDSQFVQLTAEQANVLAANGFLDGQEVELTAKAYKDLQASEFMAEETVTITGEAGNTLTAADFGLSDQTVIYLAKMDNASYEAVQKKATELEGLLTTSGSELTSAKAELEKSLEIASALETKISGTKKGKKQNQLKSQLEEINTTIEEQKSKVDELQEKHDALQAEYGIVAQAAEELNGQEEALKASKDALVAASDGVITASDSETEAFNEQAKAAKEAAEANIELARLKLYENLNQQSAAYAKSLREQKTAQDNLAGARQKEASLLDQINNYEGTNSAQLRTQYELTKQLYGEWSKAPGAWTGGAMMSDELIEAGTKLQAMVKELTGVNYTIEDLMNGEASTKMEGWILDLDELRASYTQTGQAAQGYQQQVDEAAETQAKYIDALTQAMMVGAITEDQLRAQLTDAFKDEADGAAMVEDIMNQVMTAYAGASEAAEDYADASEEVGDSQEDAGAAVESIIEELKTLQKEYDEAYKSAYSSMSGQFKMFEDASAKIKEMQAGYKGGTKGMTAGIESQTEYVEQYTANFELAQAKLAEAGVSAETANAILSGLSDGSAESGAALESIASGTTEEAQKLAEAYQNLETAKSKFSTTVATMETDFATRMQNLATKLTTTIQNMDKSSEAAQKAKNTLSAYVNAADGYKSIAAAKWGAVAKAAVDAMNQALSLLKTPKFASGTMNAPPGMALVGEEGPELVMFRGGEKVLNAHETKALVSNNTEALEASSNKASTKGGGTNYTVTLSPQYNIASGVSANEVAAVLANHTESLRSQLEAALKDIKEDEERRAFA